MSETIADRLERERKVDTAGTKESYRSLARRAGIGITTLLAILRGSEPKDLTLEIVARNLGKDVVYWRYGLQTVRAKSNGKEARP